MQNCGSVAVADSSADEIRVATGGTLSLICEDVAIDRDSAAAAAVIAFLRQLLRNVVEPVIQLPPLTLKNRIAFHR